MTVHRHLPKVFNEALKTLRLQLSNSRQAREQKNRVVTYHELEDSILRPLGTQDKGVKVDLPVDILRGGPVNEAPLVLESVE